jgi:hypothetical protein
MDIEGAMIAEAMQKSIPRKLGDELIDAAREAVAAHTSFAAGRPARFAAAMRRLEELVGDPNKERRP